ncbi:MAG: hypothetical protein JW883_01015 [Deltaproteobacteria bacterium]|nr:hypothetical protein [Deltaproteobacteria bacterium]
MRLPYGNEINYWRTNTSQPEKWLDRATSQIETLAGRVLMYALGQDATTGTSAYVMMFGVMLVWNGKPEVRLSLLFLSCLVIITFLAKRKA